MTDNRPLTGVERTFSPDDLVVTKTDPNGKIVYANDIFINISGYPENELLGRPHSVIRHPDMPRAIFQLLWDRVRSGREIFAYVQNRCENGDHYWVLAHVTPNFDQSGGIVGYHSSRRVARREALDLLRPVYQRLRSLENAGADRKAGLVNSSEELRRFVRDKGFDGYDQFIMSTVR